jgi:hypothetical protein
MINNILISIYFKGSWQGILNKKEQKRGQVLNAWHHESNRLKQEEISQDYAIRVLTEMGRA